MASSPSTNPHRGSRKLFHDANSHFRQHHRLSLPSASASASEFASASALSAASAMALSAAPPSPRNVRSPSPSVSLAGASAMRHAIRELVHTVADRRSKRSVYDPRGYVSVRDVDLLVSKPRLRTDESSSNSSSNSSNSSNSNKSSNSSSSTSSNSNSNSREEDRYLVSKGCDFDEETVWMLGNNRHGKERYRDPPGHPSYGSTDPHKPRGKNDDEIRSGKDDSSRIEDILQQASAVAVVSLMNMMVAIPFGASYFPIGWRALESGEEITSEDTNGNGDSDSDGIHGLFPIEGKQNLGLRMFLLATMLAQLVYAYRSRFVNAVGSQMVENIPFLHALAKIVIRHQGYGKEALSTLFFLFGFGSVLVGMVFYVLGSLRLGKIVYFFPNHVLVGCIGGIGVFMVVTAIEVTTNTTFDIARPEEAVRNAILDRWHLLWVVVALEVTLRLLLLATKDPATGRPRSRYRLLAPLFYLCITPLFYAGLVWGFGMSLSDGREAGYFFPSLGGGGGGNGNGNGGGNNGNDNGNNDNGNGSPGTAFGFGDPTLWDVFRVLDLSTVSWSAVADSAGTMAALAAFSLIHVPINIPAFAISTDVETDMNAELIAHGWSNALSGMVGGLQNYMTYSNSVLFAKAGGRGRTSSLAIVAVTAALFVYGPSLTDYLPRCMAGTLLLHIGIDLTLEGVYDSIGQYDAFEYAGIWLIAIVMTGWGMTAAMGAGILTALFAYAAQSINYHDPVRQVLTATSLRSSAWTRCARAQSILSDSQTGRSRILIFQLQGHLFFGNVALLTDTIKDVLKDKAEEGDLPIVVIVDFTLVLGIDSSAAHAVAKLKKLLHRVFDVELSIFCTGSDRGGFPCEFALSEALSPPPESVASANLDASVSSFPPCELQDSDSNSDIQLVSPSGPSNLSVKGTVFVSSNTASRKATEVLATRMDGRVCETLDDALQFAEDMLICRQDGGHKFLPPIYLLDEASSSILTREEERSRAKTFLRIGMDNSSADFLERSVDMIVSRMLREEYRRGDILWDQGADSSSLKVVVSGELLSLVDETGASEIVKTGSIVGELGLVHGTSRLTTLACSSPTAVLYSLDVESWRDLRENHPKVASLIDGIVIRYLAHRVQHVSNRYFHTTLPV